MGKSILDSMLAKNINVQHILSLADHGYGMMINSIMDDIKGGHIEDSFGDFVLNVTKKNKFGYVYIIKGTNDGVFKYKIGKANNLRDRIRTFTVKIPFDIDIVTCFYVKNPLFLESKLHRLMRDNRIVGEWFDLNKEEIENLCLHGMALESEDLGYSILSEIARLNRIKKKTDAEYIEYLEDMLVMNNIDFTKQSE